MKISLSLLVMWVIIESIDSKWRKPLTYTQNRNNTLKTTNKTKLWNGDVSTEIGNTTEETPKNLRRTRKWEMFIESEEKGI